MVENSVAEHDNSADSDNDNRDRLGGGNWCTKTRMEETDRKTAVLKKDMQSALHW
jgi:hypothetical protein